jgi:hypothetical protein
MWSASRRRTRSAPATGWSGTVPVGGSTGTVVSGATSRLTRNGACGVTAAIAPDLGERYIDTVYQSNCGEDLYGPDVLNSVDLSTAHRPV